MSSLTHPPSVSLSHAPNTSVIYTVVPWLGVGLALPSAVAGKELGQLCTALVHQHGLRGQPRHLLLHSHYPDRVLKGSTGQDFTMTSGGSAGCPYQAIPLYPCNSSSSSLHNAQVILLLSLSHLSTIHLHSMVAPFAGQTCSNRPLNDFCPTVLPGVATGRPPQLCLLLSLMYCFW